jgi:hypothetical protein
MKHKQYEVDPEVTNSLIETINHPNFKKFISDIEAQPEAERLEYARKITNIDEMRKRHIPINEKFRITLRTFEDPSHPLASFDYNPAKDNDALRIGGTHTICGSVGYIACATYGYSWPATDTPR